MAMSKKHLGRGILLACALNRNLRMRTSHVDISKTMALVICKQYIFIKFCEQLYIYV